MSVTSEILEEKRKLFNEFAKTLLPDEILNSESLSFVDLANRVDSLQNRKVFCARAIEILEANIEHYRPLAKKVPMPNRNNTFVVASTLIIAGVVHYEAGVSLALVVASIWYWFAAQSATQRLKEQTNEVEQHNSEADGWLETLKGWEMDRDELRFL